LHLPAQPRESAAKFFSHVERDESGIGDNSLGDDAEEVDKERGITAVHGSRDLRVDALEESVKFRKIITRDSREEVVFKVVVEVAHEKCDNLVADNGPCIDERIAARRHSVFGESPDVRQLRGNEERIDPDLRHHACRKGDERACDSSDNEAIFEEDLRTNSSSGFFIAVDGDGDHVQINAEEKHNAIGHNERQRFRGAILDAIRVIG